ncbi:MAG: UDP-N-acetylglucosamine--N-acetylmuramyl-(pentapeptide) pyrophosphoryl-undecaprenol N-acetylglucosamine transferase [Smithella sp.]
MIRRICVVAGGTGGHIVPAIAFAQWMKISHPDVDLQFIHGSREMEKEIFEAHGIESIRFPVSGSPLGVSFGLRQARRWAEMIQSTFLAWKCVKKTSPDILLLFGGYVSVPFLVASRLCSVKAFVHEQNATMGRVSRIASYFGVPVLEGWTQNRTLLKSAKNRLVGVPVRKFLRLSRCEALEKLKIRGIPVDSPIVGILGGSLGSQELVKCISCVSRDVFFSSWHFLIQGDESRYISPNIHVCARSWDMSPFYSALDIALSRAGGSTLAELLEYGIETVVVPWKESSGGHQTENAKRFSLLGGGSVSTAETHDVEIHLREALAKKTNRDTNRFSTNNLFDPCEKIWGFIDSTNAEGRVYP